jgi:hypothetical protein
MDWDAWVEEVQLAKQEFARLINASPDEIAVFSSVSGDERRRERDRLRGRPTESSSPRRSFRPLDTSGSRKNGGARKSPGFPFKME